jgi:hypothetical protein
METVLRRLMLRDPQTEQAVEISRNPCWGGLTINGDCGWDPDLECASHTLIAAMLLGASGADSSNGISQVAHFDDFTHSYWCRTPTRGFSELKPRPVIDAVFADAISAFHHLERGPFGKMVISVGI